MSRFKALDQERRNDSRTLEEKELPMSIDLKPLTNEVIHKMGYSTHDLWVVKYKEEVFGPFEVDSLKHYATENENLFQECLASRMDSNDWHAFYSYAQFTEIGEHAVAHQAQIEKFWILQNGQKQGPLSRFDIQKKLEMNILGFNELVSFDEGHSWHKFYEVQMFQELLKNADSLPTTPSDLELSYAREEIAEGIGQSQTTETLNGVAALAYLGNKKEGHQLNLNEIDLKLLNQTEVSRSLKWAVPAMVAGLVVVVGLVTVISNKHGEPDQFAVSDKNQEVVEPNGIQTKQTNVQRPSRRQPASYQPMDHQNRSGLTQAHPIHHEPFQGHQEPQSYEPEMPVDQPMESEPPQEVDQVAEHSLVSPTPGNESNESLDQAMNMAEQPPQPEAPPVEEAGDF